MSDPAQPLAINHNAAAARSKQAPPWIMLAMGAILVVLLAVGGTIVIVNLAEPVAQTANSVTK